MEHRCPEALGGHSHCYLGSLQLGETRLPGQASLYSRRLGWQAGRTLAPALGSSPLGAVRWGNTCADKNMQSPVSHTPLGWPVGQHCPPRETGSPRPRQPCPRAREG